MPFRRFHLCLLALFPLILLAFWPGYFGRLRSAPFALHAHGITATAWIALAAFQAWTVGARRPTARGMALHRAAGRAVFVLVPLFAAAGLLAMRDMAALGVREADPFHARFGVPLALLDATSSATFLGLVGWGLARRRRVGAHAGAMMATVLLVLPPVLGRLAGRLLLPGAWLEAVPSLGFHMGQLGAAALAAWLARREPRSAAPLNVTAAVLVAQSVALDTVARGAAWQAVAAVLAETPAPLVAGFGLAAAGAVLWSGWRWRPPAPTPALAGA